MRQAKFSRTAYGVALRRAAHQLFDDPKVLDDPLALRIVGQKAVETLRPRQRGDQSPVARALRAFIAARSRYAEDQLAVAVDRGIAQYVVLGAGLDTSAYRSRHAGLRMFEIDHPATQTWKRDCLQAASITIPPSLTFVPIDFERETLVHGLQQSGFDLNSPAFFSWLGVTPYLTLEACLATLAFIARLPSGGGVVFDFIIHRDLLTLRQKLALYAVSRRVAAAGEPFRLFFDPGKLINELRRVGFTHIETLDGAEINRRYFRDRTDDLRVSDRLGQIMGAWV
ncbi:MAG: class I SAM-dependent methyltransferase [Candidatus Sulfotelmatobacter sp.]